VVQRIGGYAGYGELNSPVRMAAHRRQRAADRRRAGKLRERPPAVAARRRTARERREAERRDRDLAPYDRGPSRPSSATRWTPPPSRRRLPAGARDRGHRGPQSGVGLAAVRAVRRPGALPPSSSTPSSWGCPSPGRPRGLPGRAGPLLATGWYAFLRGPPLASPCAALPPGCAAAADPSRSAVIPPLPSIRTVAVCIRPRLRLSALLRRPVPRFPPRAETAALRIGGDALTPAPASRKAELTSGQAGFLPALR
jgi:hypothetical protein